MIIGIENESNKILPAIKSKDYLTVLICSANVGNAEPTAASFGEWIPNDGEILGTIRDTPYPVMKTSNGGDSLELSLSDIDVSEHLSGDLKKVKKMLRKLEKKAKKYDIIVMGMQEAAFTEKSKKKQHSGVEEDLDTSERVSERGGYLSDDAGDVSLEEGAIQNGSSNVKASMTSSMASNASENKEKRVGSGLAEKGSKTPKKIFKQIVKVNLMLRGVTASQTYTRNPTLRDKDNATAKMKQINVPTSYDSRKFRELISNQCPSYELVVSFLRGEMRLFILALEKVADEIGDSVCINAENTGIGSVLANKGGIIATITLRKTRLSFMTAHLEAHEGVTHYTNRNKNIAAILSGAKPDPNYSMHDASILSHHMFVCGDLNYRIRFEGNNDENGNDSDVSNGDDKKKRNSLIKKNMLRKQLSKQISKQSSLETSDSDGKEAPYGQRLNSRMKPNVGLSISALKTSFTAKGSRVKEEELIQPDNGSFFNQAKKLVDEENWDELNRGDELAMALRKKECLVDFKTLPCNWPPTFKVARKEGYEYNEKRTPSYTDRILWHSADGMESNVMPFLYEPTPDFITSDHKPIRGAFAVKMNDRPPSKKKKREKSTKPPQLSGTERQIHLLVTDLKCTNLPIMDSELMGGLSDPYVLFVSSPKKLLWQKAWPSTKIISRNLNPIWEEDIHLAVDSDCTNNEGRSPSLAGAMLYLTVMDYDMSSGDDVIGTVVLNLSNLCSELDFTNTKESSFNSKSHRSATAETSDKSLTHEISRKMVHRRSSTGEVSTIELPVSNPRDTLRRRRSAEIASKVESKHKVCIQETIVSKPIMRNGLEFGRLECTILAGYLTPKETKSFLRITKKLGKTKNQSAATTFKNRLTSYLPF